MVPAAMLIGGGAGAVVGGIVATVWRRLGRTRARTASQPGP
jgi:hypothetical protein